MDMRMPVMDGYEATRRIKALEAGRDTPVFAVTAGAFKDSEQEVLATGVSAYLRKPFQAEEVLARVRTHLILRRMQRELERHNLIFLP
jgi:CheY-like chemotaxis protein